MSDAPKPDFGHLIDCVDLIFNHTIDLCRGISDEQGELATGCPGWSVKDQLSHMVGLEQMLSGSPNPRIELPQFGHVKNDVGHLMELHVHARRPLPLAAVVDEMVGLRPRRIDQLREQAAQGDIEVPGLLGGTRPLSQALPIRVMDLWSHEQDIRRAAGVATRTDGPDGDVAETRTLNAWLALLPKNVEGPGRVSIGFADGNHSSATIELSDRDGDESDGPHITVAGTRSDLTQLAFGRRPLDQAPLRVTVDGDAELWRRVRPHLGFTP